MNPIDAEAQAILTFFVETDEKFRIHHTNLFNKLHHLYALKIGSMPIVSCLAHLRVIALERKLYLSLEEHKGFFTKYKHLVDSAMARAESHTVSEFSISLSELSSYINNQQRGQNV